MFREMRRMKQQLSDAEAMEVLMNGKTGILAVHGDDGYPYAIPLNYICKGGSIYFHCAAKGHKIDSVRSNDKVSFCVVDDDTVIAEKLTTAYRSVVAFGRAKIVENLEEKENALKLLCEKYAPGMNSLTSIAKSLPVTCIVDIKIEHLTGKQGKEFKKK